MSRILIIGDSFAAHHPQGWTCQLGNDHEVTNLASNGASQYRLFRTVTQTNLDGFDFVVVGHTSPNRIYVEKNPYYQQSQTHHNCDLIYEDMRSKLPDSFAGHVTWWFENVFDLEQAKHTHELLCDKIKALVAHKPVLHVSFFEIGYIADIKILHHIWNNHPGTINHLDETGNQLVAKFVKDQVKLYKQRTL